MKWLIFLFLAAAEASGAGAGAPDQVARVMSGELKEARASWWGFNKDDATSGLQSAIRSRVPRLIVDNVGSPWITDKLSLVSDQEIVFERGVEILAKQGAFTGTSDSLFSLISLTNVTLRGPGATLRMRRADYDAPPYKKAEWRHVLNIKSCVNIKVYGLTLAESGGDGIYLGSARKGAPNVGIHIKDVLCDKNYRQGISVISAEDLLIENTVMRLTAGTPPAAGIDFEPNHDSERLKNCVMRDCVTVSNQGDGFDFYLPNLKGTSEPIDIRLENCISAADRTSVNITTGNSPVDAVRGRLWFNGCRFESPRGSAVGIHRKPASGMAVALHQCSIATSAAAATNTPAILLTNRIEDELPVGGIRLDRVEITSPTTRPWIAWRNNTTVTEPVAQLQGDVTVVRAGSREEIKLTPEWVAKMFPPRFTVRVPRVAVDFSKMHVVEPPTTAAQSFSPIRLRRAGTYVFHATPARDVVLAGRHTQVGRYSASGKPLLIRSPSGKVVRKTPLPPFRETAEIRFTPTEGGFHTLEVDVGANAFTLVSANVPVAIDATKKAVGFISSTGALFVPVPKHTSLFAVGVAGEGDGEAVKISIIDPSGVAVWSRDNVTQMERFTATEGQGERGGVWQLKFERPSTGAFEDFHVEILGAPGFLFLNPQRYWQPGEGT